MGIRRLNIALFHSKLGSDLSLSAIVGSYDTLFE